nr:reverse transcriptase domain-containing protein [Tanacetum cinerariifolium]
KEITFPPLANSNGTEGSLVIEAEVGGHTIHRMYIDGGSSMEILYEHCFNRLRPDIKRQMVPATTSLTGFSGETTWPLGQLKLLAHPANLTVPLHPNFLDQEVVVKGSLSDEGRTELCSLLKRNLDIFAWQPSDMTGVPRSVAEHRLNVREGCPPVRQKKRGQAPERTKALQAEVEKLVEAGIMREFYYHDWLSNPVMVKKHDGSWRMCVDFTDLNKACPQDCYPLPEIYWKVESLCGYPFKCFLDAYKGYHQIQMAAADEEKTAFHTGQGTLKKCIKKSDFRWTMEAEQAFQQLKQHLSALPLLAAPKPREELIMYLSATHGAISAVLMIERGTAQRPVYFISRALQGPELNYSPMEKLVLSLVFAAKRLRRYFQTHPITGQILADFLNEMPSNAPQGASVAETQEEPWTLFTDDSSCVDGSGAGLILTNPDGVKFTYALRFQFAASNNKAEYEALIAASDPNHSSVAVLQVGNRHSKPLFGRAEESKVPDSRNGLLHEVDRSKSSGNDYRRTIDVVNNDEELRLNLDLLGERQELAAISEAKSKSKMMKYYNARVRGVAFKTGDFVYRSNDTSHALAGGKLGPKWEGPYEVTEALGNGAYKLRSTEGTVLQRMWNVTNLKRCYLRARIRRIFLDGYGVLVVRINNL